MLLLFLCTGSIQGRQLPSELPADLLSTRFIWIRRGVVVPPLPRPLRHLTRLHPKGWAARGDHRSELSQGVQGHGRHTWKPQMPRQTAGPRYDGHAGCQPPRRSSCSQASLILGPTGFFTIAARAAKNLPRTVFLLPRGKFLHAPGRQLLRNLHKGGTYSASGNRLRGSTSGLVHSSAKASARGGAPVEAAYAPPMARPSMATVLCTPAQLYTVYSPCI
jgi:hypothetical protein